MAQNQAPPTSGYQNHPPAMYDYPPPPTHANSFPLRPENMYSPPSQHPPPSPQHPPSSMHPPPSQHPSLHHSPSLPNPSYYQHQPTSQYPPSPNHLYNHPPSPYEHITHPSHPSHPSRLPHPGVHPAPHQSPGPYLPMPPPTSQPMPGTPYDHPSQMPPPSYNPTLPPHQQPTPAPPTHSYQPYPPQYPHPPHHVSPLPPFNPLQYKPTPQRIQTAQVKLEISAKGLRDRDLASKSDPTCVVFAEEKAYNYGVAPATADGDASYPNSPPIQWREMARTECIKNNLNPHFKVQIPVPYHFEEIQNIRFGLWDIDSGKSELSHHDFLGEVRTTLGELVTNGVWTAKLTSSNAHDLKKRFGGLRDLGTITVIVHETRDGGQLLIKASMSAQKLKRKSLSLSSDPFFIVTQVGASSAQSRSQLYESEVIRWNLNPVWRPFQIKPTLPKGGGNQQVTLEFLVYDKDRQRKNDEIGKVVCSVADLETGTPLPIINEKKKRKDRKYKNSGTLKLSKFSAVNMPSLVDYLQGGLKLHFSVAVDLTRSNGDPSEPLSLHFRQDAYGNHYIRALSAIANVLRVYTPSDNLFAAFGFGAELPGRPGFTSACFPLGLDAGPHCHGIEGVLNAYNVALSNVKLSGPTLFAPIIDEVARSARKRPNSQTNQNYDVLLILTDGVVSDFDATVDRIITASKTVPLSIIIIGIGNRDFKKMRDLDHDEGLLQSRDGTRQADRDICQFVAFKEYEHAPPERLGSAVLQELPGNIVEYFVGACEPPIMPGQRPVMPPLNS